MTIPKYDADGNATKATLKLDPTWITNKKGLDNDAVTFAEHFGRYLTDPQLDNRKRVIKTGRDALTTSQLRNFFSEIRRIQMKGFKENISDFYMLKPKLAYATARVLKEKRYNRIKDFSPVITTLINKVIEEQEEIKHFDNFVKFVEATVAYHKAFGGN